MVQPTKMPHYVQEFSVSSVGRITGYAETFRAFRQSLQSKVRIAAYINAAIDSFQFLSSSLSDIYGFCCGVVVVFAVLQCCAA